MTRQQAAWAEQHDWFISAGAVRGKPLSWVVHVRPSFEGDTQVYFKDYQELRNWAGY
jgi:hypothetical protein